MNKDPQSLPLTDEPFRKIIRGNYLYSDKTEYIHNMINSYTCCFLSRPRRFGKTLLLDTVDELFRGDRELFEGLWIDTDSSYEFARHPVLRFNMAYPEISTRKDLKYRIERDLRRAAETEDVKIIGPSYDEMLEELLEGLFKKYKVGAVVLIDEYDAPVAGHISDRKLAEDCSNVLHGFYTSLKKNIRFIRFALVTGITRFAMTALDSGPNNFMDISLDPDFSGICGFPVSELE
ncbi:MAG: AAA family ATPase, partial [Deltaproteobacteria bacterium]|nr:AAA family ATPase [Deltaproteobacteria bacterium]